MKGGRTDDASLESAAGPEVAVKLDVQPEQQNEGNQYLAHHAQDEVVPHRSWPRARRCLAPPINSMTPIPAVKITTTSPSVS